MKQIIFSQFVQYPPLPIVPDLSDPAKFNGSTTPSFDLSNTTNLFITSPKGTQWTALKLHRPARVQVVEPKGLHFVEYL